MNLALLLAVIVVTIVLFAVKARAQSVEDFTAGNQKTAAELTDEKVEKFLVFWETRSEFTRSATPSVMAGLKDGGYGGAIAAAQRRSKIYKSADEAAAAQSGLSEREGMALFMLLVNYYHSIYAATNSHNEQWLASTRDLFGRLYGAAALELVKRHEAQAVPLVAAQMQAFKTQMGQ